MLFPTTIVGSYPQRHMAGVGHADAKAPPRARRVERRSGLAQALQPGQHFAHGADQCVGARRRHHALRRAHDQRVVELFAQLRQPDTDGGLALPQRLGRARHAAGAVQLVQQAQQLHIEQQFGRHGVPGIVVAAILCTARTAGAVHPARSRRSAAAGRQRSQIDEFMPPAAPLEANRHLRWASADRDGAR